MGQKFKMEEMTPAEFKRAVSERPVFIVGTGILEWHADHLPLGTDALKMRGIAERLAEAIVGHLRARIEEELAQV